jgi:hypothetical protein
LAEPFHTQREWALAYLRGRAEAYRRRKLTSGSLVGAVHMALKRSVALNEIRTLLAQYGLDWDADRLDVRANAANALTTRAEVAEIVRLSQPPDDQVTFRVKPDRRLRQEPFKGFDRRLSSAPA